ncbi:MAG: biotin synthase BioB [Bacteroidota bacterium]|nr:biotin synthase BioB [Bacteroidota bacterium]
MFKQTQFNKRKQLRFRRWSRKGYAIFVSRHYEVIMSECTASVSSGFLPKTKSIKKQMLSVSQLEEKVLSGERLTEEEALWLALHAEKEALYAAANRIREHFCGNKMDLCTILNAKSGKCSEDCKWCSQSAHHKTNIQVYDLVNPQEAFQQAKHNEAAGAHKFSLVTSGRAISHHHLDKLCKIYSDLKKETPKLELCASMGLLDREKMQKLVETGVKNYHCNIETAPSFFSELCSTHTTEEKIETIRIARDLGMGICSGGIIGMGETMEQRVEMALTLQELEVESIPLNILNPIEGTKLENQSPLTDEEILTTIAVFRFVNPKAMIRFAGGRNLILHIQDKALKAGINAALIGDLLTTIGSKGMKQDIEDFKTAGFDVARSN